MRAGEVKISERQSGRSAVRFSGEAVRFSGEVSGSGSEGEKEN